MTFSVKDALLSHVLSLFFSPLSLSFSSSLYASISLTLSSPLPLSLAYFDTFIFAHIHAFSLHLTDNPTLTHPSLSLFLSLSSVIVSPSENAD